MTASSAKTARPFANPQDNGYATSWFGKEHNTPAFEAKPGRAIHPWPIGMGFEYSYGFVVVNRQPVAAQPVSPDHGNLSVISDIRAEPDHRHGR